MRRADSPRRRWRPARRPRSPGPCSPDSRESRCGHGHARLPTTDARQGHDGAARDDRDGDDRDVVPRLGSVWARCIGPTARPKRRSTPTASVRRPPQLRHARARRSVSGRGPEQRDSGPARGHPDPASGHTIVTGRYPSGRLWDDELARVAFAVDGWKARPSTDPRLDQRGLWTPPAGQNCSRCRFGVGRNGDRRNEVTFTTRRDVLDPSGRAPRRQCFRQLRVTTTLRAPAGLGETVRFSWNDDERPVITTEPWQAELTIHGTGIVRAVAELVTPEAETPSAQCDGHVSDRMFRSSRFPDHHARRPTPSRAGRDRA